MWLTVKIKSLEPCVGITSGSQYDACSLHLKYERFIGVGISTKQGVGQRLRENLLIRRSQVCTRYWVKRERNADNQRSSLKMNCEAMLRHVKRHLNGKWYIHNFVKKHNHIIFHAIGTSLLQISRILKLFILLIVVALADESGGHKNLGFSRKGH